MNKNVNSLRDTFILLVVIITFITAFIVKAVKAGRTLELLVSTTALFLEWYLTYVLLKHIDSVGLIGLLLCYGIPLLVYSVCWLYWFSHEKITSKNANPNWADRDWWWSLNGWEFEEEVARIFRLNGYQASVTKKTGDGGADIIMYKGPFKYIVQCKHYKEKAPVSCVRELNGIKEDFEADKLIIVASSGLSKEGNDFIKSKSYYTSLNLEELIKMGLRPRI